eukprot:COSAG02_NODE_187_length_30377_cov_3.636271_9_plen_150_part_00
MDLNRSPNWRPAPPVEGVEAIGGADISQALGRLPDGALDSWYTGCTQDGALIGNLTGTHINFCSVFLVSLSSPAAESVLLTPPIPCSGDAGSGGYLESVFRYAAQELFGVTIGMDTPLEYKTMRNADFKGDRICILTESCRCCRFSSPR